MWVAIAIVAVPVLLYLFAFTLNWRDQPPNAEALELAAAPLPEPIPDPANAYVYLLGFALPRVGDPTLIGATRAEWIRKLAADPEMSSDSDPYPGSAPDFQQVPEALAPVLTPCGNPDAGCVAAFETAAAALGEQLEQQRPLIERYRTLLTFRAWRDVSTRDLRSPLPPYAEVGYARRLFLLDTWLLAAAGNATEVRARLDADLVFWRMALVESDFTFGKVIAASYANLNFLWGNLILRQLPPERRADGVPESWRKPITDPERSMRRALTNEWRVVDASLQFMKEHDLEFPRTRAGQPRPFLGRMEAKLELPLFKAQATSNRYAAMYVKLDALLSVPYAELGEAVARAAEADEPPKGVLAVTYNVFGNALGDPEPSLFANEAARVADLEGGRRAALMTADLRVLKIPPELAAAMIPLAASRDPYTGGPFVWTAEPATVSFTGLERTSDTRHRFLY